MIVIIGASASGKTEIAKILSNKYKYKKSVTTTTREIRSSETEGVDYHFLKMDTFIRLMENDQFVAITNYQNNYYGLNINNVNHNSLIILDPSGANELIAEKGEEVFIVYIESPIDKRRERMINRRDDLTSINKRLASDDMLFSPNNLDKIDLHIVNTDEPLKEHAKEIYNKYQNFKNTINLKGKYCNAKIFTKNVESSVIEQLNDILNDEYSKDTKIRVMPDTHQGFGVPIGYTQNLIDKVIPNFVGVDIGCGMLVTKISNDPNYQFNFHKLEKVIQSKVPSGFNVFDKRQDLDVNVSDLIANINIDRAYKSLGTLGGGNHFIEVNKGAEGVYLVIHSGSRHLGVEVCNFWQKKVTNDNPYLTGDDFNGYLHDMDIAQRFASANRKAMRNNIFNYMNWDKIEEFETIHNYIDLNNMILRKGAISAKKDELVIIPINMRDGSILARGLGNSDWNYSAPHGAGRVMSRTAAKKTVNLEEFKDTMKGVWTESISAKTLDEAPFVYKDLQEIIGNTKETIEVLEVLKVLYNYKAQ